MPKVLITGANKGLGKALTSEFSEHGWELLLIVRNPESETKLREEFPQASVLVSDVSTKDHQSKVKDWLGEKAIDVLINNAGTGSRGASLESATSEQISSALDTNCLGAFATVKGAYNSLKKSDSGLVLNVSSRRGSLTMQASGAAKNRGCSYSYRISKAAQNMLTLCLADELEEDGISVATIHPGRLLTDMASEDAHMTPEKSAALIAELILNNGIRNRDFLCMESDSLPW